MEFVRTQLKFEGCFSVDSEGNRSGLGLLFKDANSIKVVCSSLNYIDFEYNSSELGVWRITGYYSKPKRSRKRVS